MMKAQHEAKPASVPSGDKQAGEDLWQRYGAERGVWTEPMLIALEKGIKGRLHEIYGMEETLYYPDQYAGTADLIGFYEGKDVVVDSKQANKPKKIDYIQDYFLQLGAYTLAHDIVHGTKMKAGIILLCTKDNLFQEFKIEGAELEMYQNLFLGRVKKFYEINNIT